MADAVDMAVACELAAIADVQAALRAFGEAHGLSDRIVHGLELAADEMLSNVIRHGFPDAQHDRDIRCSAHVADGTVAFAIRDNGAPFDPLEDAPPPDLESGAEDAPIGGLGVHIVKSLADSCGYSRDDGRNRLELRWNLGGD